MDFYKDLDLIMKQDFGNRGLLAYLPANPAEEAAASLLKARRAIILTGFPVRLENGDFVGETDGPSGTANLAASLTALGCEVCVVTDSASYGLLHAALSFRAPEAALKLLPSGGTENFIREFMSEMQPDHFISLEHPGKAADGHYHNMRGEIIDDITVDSARFLQEAKKIGAVTVSIGDGGNEMGMGCYKEQIIDNVPSGELICTREAADITLAGGVSNWWAWGLSAALSYETGLSLLPSSLEETALLKQVVHAGAVDGCTKRNEMTVDHLSLETHLSVLNETASLTARYFLRGKFAGSGACPPSVSIMEIA